MTLLPLLLAALSDANPSVRLSELRNRLGLFPSRGPPPTIEEDLYALLCRFPSTAHLTVAWVQDEIGKARQGSRSDLLPGKCLHNHMIQSWLPWVVLQARRSFSWGEMEVPAAARRIFDLAAFENNRVAWEALDTKGRNDLEDTAGALGLLTPTRTRTALVPMELGWNPASELWAYLDDPTVRPLRRDDLTLAWAVDWVELDGSRWGVGLLSDRGLVESGVSMKWTLLFPEAYRDGEVVLPQRTQQSTTSMLWALDGMLSHVRSPDGASWYARWPEEQRQKAYSLAQRLRIGVILYQLFHRRENFRHYFLSIYLQMIQDWMAAETIDRYTVSLPEAFQAAIAWHLTLQSGALYRKPVVHGDVLLRWPDGATLEQLTTKEALRQEGESMGHCVGGPIDPKTGMAAGGGQYWTAVREGRIWILSYRDPEGVPQATFDVRPTPLLHGGGDAQVAQLQGPDDGPIASAVVRGRLYHMAMRWMDVRTLGFRQAAYSRLADGQSRHEEAFEQVMPFPVPR